MLVLAGAGWIAATAPEKAPPPYRVAKIERGDVVKRVEATGTLEPVTLVQVGSQISGRVAAVEADYNDPVRKGQVLARLDAAKLEALLQEAEALLERAGAEKVAATAEQQRNRAEAEYARAQLERLRQLRRRGLGSVSALEQARTNLRIAQAKIRETAAKIAIAEAEIRRRRALLRQRRIELERSVIRAPVDGVVIERNIEPGQTVAASLQAPTLFTLAGDLHAMQVVAAVDEADIGLVAPGQTAEFTVDAFPRRRYTGVVTQIRKAPQVSQNVVTYEVLITTRNDDLSLLPGMTASVRLEVAKRRDVLRVPVAALRFRPRGTTPAPRPRIWLPTPGGLQAVTVEPGLSDDRFVEIRAPRLQPGRTVVVGYDAAKP